MTFLQEASLRLEKRLVEAAESKATQRPHGEAQNKRNENGSGHDNDNNHMENNYAGNDDGRCAPADNFWGVINRARGLRPSESNIFGDCVS